VEKKFIYLDNAATTRISDEVFDTMLPYLKDSYGNASSIYKLGRDADVSLTNARASAAKSLGADTNEIYFTSGGSESDNWAIKSVAHTLAKKNKRHIISSAFEHHAVLHSLDALKSEGFDITLLSGGADGLITVSDVEAAIREDTALVTIMYVNNEIGTIQPIAEIAKICKAKGVLFHTDAVQAIGNVPINVHELGVDLLSLSGHKIHAQKGVGILYVRKLLNLVPLIDGGAQEKGRRAGTENLAGIAGLAKALETACNYDNIARKNAKLKPFQEKIIESFSKITHSRLNGDKDNRVPFNVNFSFIGVEGEALLLCLDNVGIAVSSGSACTSGSLDPSHVLLSLGLDHATAHGSLRVTMSEETSEEDIEYLIEQVPKVIEKLRNMSPLWEHIIEKEKQEEVK
jgi:cysteine desulfurase